MDLQNDLGLEDGDPAFVSHSECMSTENTLPNGNVLISVGGTTTDENGAYELTLKSGIDTYIITAQGGNNIVTGEPNSSSFTVSSRVSYHVNPASELASDLIEEGMSVEEAKDKVIEFVNSDLSNVASLGGDTEPLSKEDLFDRSMTKDMESQNRKGAMKAVVFNTLNNIKEMLVEAVESDAPSAEEVEKEVRKAIAKELRLINHKEGQNVNISNLVESAIDRVGEEIELVELKEVSKKSIIGSTINSQSHELTSIDLGGSNVYRTIAAVETKRHEIKDEKSMVEQLVKIDVSVESDDESKLSALKNIKSAKKEEIEEERKSKEPVNFESKLDIVKERLELQEQISDLIEEAGLQIAHVRGITKYDEKEFLSMLKNADAMSAEFNDLKSEIKERNDIEDLGFDEGKFEKVQSAIDELYTVLKKQQQLLSEGPTLGPIDGIKPIDGEPGVAGLGNIIGLHGGGDDGARFKKQLNGLLGPVDVTVVTPNGGYEIGPDSYTWLPVVDKEAGETTSNADVADKSVDAIMDAINSPMFIKKENLIQEPITLLGYSDGAAMIIAFLGRAIERGLDISRIKRVIFVKGYAEGERHQGLDFSEAEFVPFEGIDSYFIAGQNDIGFYQSTLDAMSYFNEPGLVVNKGGDHEFELADVPMWLSERVAENAPSEPIDGRDPIVGKDPVKDEPKEVFERGTEGYYELYKTDLDLIYNNYKDKYTPFDYPNKSHLVLEEYYVNLFNEILENHSDLIDKLQSVGEYDVFERFANMIRNYQREQFGEHESQIISQVFYNISTYSKWKHQIDNTFNSRLLDGLKDRLNANFSYVHNNYSQNKAKDHTSMNEYEIRDFVGQFAVKSIMANKLVELLDEKIKKGLENPVWVNLNDLKVVDLDEYGCGIFDFIKEENKVAFKKGDYVTDIYGSNQTHINVNDFKISEDGWKFYSTFNGETGNGYVGLPAQTKYGVNEGLNIVFILLPNSVHEDWKFHSMRPNFSNGWLNAAYPEDGSSDAIIGLDNVRKNNPEGNILMGISNRPYTGIGEYWYNIVAGYPTESTYEGYYKKGKDQFISELSRRKGLYPSYSVHSYQWFGADASKPELGVQAMYRLQSVNRFNDGNDSVYTKDYYQLNNWFTNRTNVGVMTDDLSGNLYLKYDEINVPYLYTKDGDTYSKYSGYAYTKRDQQTSMSSQNLWNERFNGEYYVVVDGAIMKDQAGRVFQINQFRGWKDCDGLERTSINRISPWTFSYSTQLNGNRSIDPEFAGWTLKLKNSISGEEESVNLDDYSVLYDVWSNDKPAVQLRDLMLKYLCNDNTNGNRLVDYGFDFENKVMTLTMVTSGYARGLGQFGITDESGNFNWESENCEDTDGDGVYDQIDGWPNDPAYSYDYDGDGIADEVDEFPYDKEPTYSVCKDMITNNYHVIPTDVSRFIDGETQFVYLTESKSGRVAHAFEFEGTVSFNVESYPVITLSSESRFYHTEFKYGGPIEMVQQITSNEGGKK
jgi:hypothetical protein